jgi:hypothetical protein
MVEQLAAVAALVRRAGVRAVKAVGRVIAGDAKRRKQSAPPRAR